MIFSIFPPQFQREQTLPLLPASQHQRATLHPKVACLVEPEPTFPLQRQLQRPEEGCPMRSEQLPPLTVRNPRLLRASQAKRVQAREARRPR